MKKVLCSVLAIMLLFAGCSAGSKQTNIESYEWTLDIVQNSATHMVEACSEDSTFNCDNKLDLKCSAKDGKLTIKDLTNGNDYVVDYEVTSQDEQTVNYKLTYENTEGKAVAKDVTNGNEVTPTFYLTLGDYSVRFFALGK